jgi:DNA adenine methylase
VPVLSKAHALKQAPITSPLRGTTPEARSQRSKSNSSRAAGKLVCVATKPSPFLKWAGGKSQLLSQYGEYFPTSFNQYFEPFIGGGAVFFHMLGKYGDLNATISDCNYDLINCYEVIRNQPTELVEALKKHKNDSDYFYIVRAQDPLTLSKVERAARIIFLNKTCFNGLYRVNRKGQFNVPFGRYNNPRICDEANIHAVSEVLSQVRIIHSSYDKSANLAKSGDFVYFDPPYQPLSATASFTSYTENSFGLADQQHLSALFAKLSAKGCKVMLSNSDNVLVRELYRGFRIETVKATRAINCKAEKRGQISELLIMNY